MILLSQNLVNFKIIILLAGAVAITFSMWWFFIAMDQLINANIC
mgnify:CR=1 FL=1